MKTMGLGVKGKNGSLSVRNCEAFKREVPDISVAEPQATAINEQKKRISRSFV